MEETGNNPGDSAGVPSSPPAISPPVTASPAAAPSTEPIVAGAGQYYRNTRYIMAALTVVMGFWFGYDGFIGWPAENATIERINTQLALAHASSDDVTQARLSTELKKYTTHNPTDIRLQRILAFALPPLGICLLAWALYNSRGEYRLADETLYVPGHPPVPLGSIRELDHSAWDRKGIAKVGYELSDGRSGKATLDDFVYDRLPTDRIYDRINAHLQPPSELPATPDSPAVG